MNRIAILIAIGMVSGCASVSYMQTNYGSVKYVQFTSPALAGGYRVWDKPAENRMLLAIDNATAVKKGLTFSPTTSEGTWRAAAVAYLASTGRTCTATGVKPVLAPTNFEVTYRCT